MRATVVCDASFYQHPSGGAVHAGWAAWVKGDGGLAVRGYGIIKPVPNMTSTTAEMYAALNGIWLAARGGATQVLVRSDCMTVAEAIQGRLRKRYLIELWAEALAAGKVQHVQLTAKHVKGHGAITDPATWVNDWCDKHARKAQHKSRKGQQCQVIL